MRSLFGNRQRQEPDLIDRLCRECGHWMLASCELDSHRIRSVTRPMIQHINVRYMEGQPSLIFQLFYPVRFSLENPPSGLFARLLLRNHSLYYAMWAMNIVQSCEAGIEVAARLPRQGVDASLFHAVCSELADEAEGFDRELKSKFNYSPGPMPPATPVSGYGTLGQAGPDVRYIGPVQHQQPGLPARYRLSDLRGG